MKLSNFFFFIGWSTISLLFVGCGNDASVEEGVVEMTGSGKMADLYRNPISLDTPEDTVNVSKILFEEDFYDFGEIKEGEVVRHEFRFKNTGTKPLLISNARSTCGCTIPKWPESPIAPGESAILEVQFDSKGKQNKQNKPITVIANTMPSDTKVYLRGFVIAKD